MYSIHTYQPVQYNWPISLFTVSKHSEDTFLPRRGQYFFKARPKWNGQGLMEYLKVYQIINNLYRNSSLVDKFMWLP